MKSKLTYTKLLKSTGCLFLLLGAGLVQAAGPVCAPTFGPVDTANANLVTLTANCNPGVGDNIATEGHIWEQAAPGPNSPFVQITNVVSGSATANALTVNLPAEGTKYRVTATSVNGGIGSVSPAVSVYSGAPSCMLKSVYPTVSGPTQTVPDAATTITAGESAVLMPVCVAATSVDWYADKPASNTLIPAPPGGIVSPAETTRYYVVASNSYGSSGSNAAVVTVNAAAPAKPLCSLNAEPLNINAGATVKLVATCLGATSFDWTGAGAPASSAAGAITVTPTGNPGPKTYTVVGKNGGIASDPASVDVNVNALPLSACTAISPATASVMVGSASPLLTATGCSNSPTSYVWKVGTTTLSCTGVTCSVPAANLPAAGSPHSVTVTANNANGSGNVAATAAITVTPAAAAAAPTVDTVTPGLGSVTVAFTPGSLNGGTLVGYQAFCQDPNKVNKFGAGTSSPVVVAGLTNGTAYRCYVRTQTNIGYSLWSAASNSVTPTLTAIQLSECSAIAPATSSVTLGSPSSALSATCSNSPTSYVWKVGAATLGCTGATCTVPAASLPAAGSYTVTVRANNADGAGTVSASATVTVDATSSATSYCGTTSNALRLTSAATAATILSNTNTWWTSLAGQSGQNHNLVMSRGQSRSIEFTTGAEGTVGSFLFDNSTVGQPVPMFINLSDKRCDFSYAQADSVEYSGVNSRACTGAARFVVQAAGSPPVVGRCSLLPNKTYFLNMRNENIALSKGVNLRGVDSCIFNGCGFLMQYNPN